MSSAVHIATGSVKVPKENIEKELPSVSRYYQSLFQLLKYFYFLWKLNSGKLNSRNGVLHSVVDLNLP